ncbi:hypothetical protein PHMEG_00023914 [Phytophthora megakarya]|uniref:Uncharacterized protein n=1 Tax=Phytophthora megakarya TaxID=4795 RepID=A0A225VHF8_9STRA|nr:hypothetical protein PHMEG_00023914 [Phytophthora megakarya]
MDLAARNGYLNMVKWLSKYRSEGCTMKDYAAGQGHLEVVKWLSNYRQEGVTTAAMDSAVKSGCLEVVNWLHTNRFEGCTSKAMDSVAMEDHLHIVKWLYNNRHEGCTSAAMDGAARKGKLQVVKWLHENRTEGCTTNAMDSTNILFICTVITVLTKLNLTYWYYCKYSITAIAHYFGASRIITPRIWIKLMYSTYLTLHYRISYKAQVLITAPTIPKFGPNQGEIVMAEWLVAHGADSSALNVAIWTVVGNGCLDVLKWLVERWRLESIILVLPKAVQKGRMNIVRWMVNWSQRSYPQDDHRRVVRWMVNWSRRNYAQDDHRRVGIATLAIHTAVVYGHLEIAKYLHKFVTVARQSVLHSREQLETIRRGIAQVFPEARIVSWRTITRAAEKGFLDTMRWLYEKYGSDPDINIFEYTESHKRWFNDTIAMDVAAAYGHLDVLKFFHELQTSGDKRLVCTWRAMDRASANGYLNVAQWLHENRGEGCSSKAMDKAASFGRLYVVRWLHEHRTEGCTHAAMDGAAMDGHLEVVQWLHVNRSEGCTKAAMECAAINGHLDVVKWLHANRSEGCNHAAMDEAAGNGFLDVVKWLHVNRSEGCTGRAMDGASGSGDLKVVQWLYANRSEGCSPDVLDFGVTGHFFEVVLFLHDHYHLEFSESALQLHEHNYNYKCFRAWMLERYPAFRDVVPHE